MVSTTPASAPWRAGLAFALVNSFVWAAAATAAAQPVSFTCVQETIMPGGKIEKAALEVVYRAGAEPMLDVKGPDGSLTLPARLQGKMEGGMYSIDAQGPGLSLMPDSILMEACVAGKLRASSATLAKYEAHTMAVNSCRNSTPKGTERVAVIAKVQITGIDAPNAQVFLSRAYAGPSVALGGPMEIDVWPMPKCKIVR